ncbi:MAG: hypothetical protein LBQ79_08975 [Deltaproteobacteria bacterium]|jgi:hypothetical protein|nr:hypothetical protein [Deltaproteobacteria bacterium]
MKRLPQYLSVVLLLAVSAACGQTIVLNTDIFVASENEYINQPGNNTIDVHSFLLNQGDDIVSCDGMKVFLWPVSRFTRDLITGITGSEESGQRTVNNISEDVGTDKVKFLEDFITNYGRKQVCNSEGHAIFTGVPDGEYYLYLPFFWMGYHKNQELEKFAGIYIVDRIRVSRGQTLNHVMTR